MQKLKIAVIAVLLFVIAIQVVNYMKRYSEKPKLSGLGQSTESSKNQNSHSGFEVQTDSEGPVSVQVTPLGLPQDKWKFEVFMNTHSVELDYDLTKLAVMVDASGREYLPVSWEGDPPGGHHRSGSLIFDALDPKPVSITLKIREIGGVGERSFIWKTSP